MLPAALEVQELVVQPHFPELVVVVEEEAGVVASSFHSLARVGHPVVAFAVSAGLLEGPV